MIKFRYMELAEIEKFVQEKQAKGFVLYSHEETLAFTKIINHIFKDQVEENLLPIKSNNSSLFDALQNGVLLAMLINQVGGEIDI